MATYYLDFVSGNDASAGTSWATAWKTLNNGATAARIAPGDEIRIAKTADPISIGDATWTNKSTTVTLATAQTTNIYLDGAWTAANGATSTTTTTRKEGTNAAQITTPASTATSTLYAYYAIGGGSGVDFSSYDAITFWFWNNTSAVADANRYVIKLCSDAAGATAVDEFAVPPIPSTGNWVPLTLKRNGGGALGSSIQSIALYTGSSSPGNSQLLRIDNFMGCDFDGLNLTSLVSKNSTAYTDFNTSDTWHGLQSINGTTVILGNRNSESTGSANLRGYFTTGTSPATVTTYIRPTIKYPMRAAGSTEQPIQDGGTSLTNQITFSGGWNTSTNTQDGETWVDGQNGQGYFIDPNGNQYLKFERLNPVRFAIGYYLTGAVAGITLEMVAVCCQNPGYIGMSESSVTFINNNCQNAITETTTAGNRNVIMNLKNLNSSGSSTISGGTATNIIHNNNRGDISFTKNININYLEVLDNANLQPQNVNFGAGANYYISEANIKNNTSSNTFYGEGNVYINKLTASGNTNIGSFAGDLRIKQTNATSSQLLGNGSSPIVPRLLQQPALAYNSVNNVTTDNRSYWQYGNALSQTTTRKTASGIAWQINITNTIQTSTRPFYFPIARVACNANALVTVKAWVKLSHATDIGAKLMIQAGEIAGVSADVTASKSADTNWEELTITFTPTIAGVAQIYVQGYWLANLADESIFVDDVTITQA